MTDNSLTRSNHNIIVLTPIPQIDQVSDYAGDLSVTGTKHNTAAVYIIIYVFCRFFCLFISNAKIYKTIRLECFLLVIKPHVGEVATH